MSDQPEFNGQKALVRALSVTNVNQLEVYDATGGPNFHLMVRNATNGQPISLGVWNKSVLLAAIETATEQSARRAVPDPL